MYTHSVSHAHFSYTVSLRDISTSMGSIATLTCCTGLFILRTSSVSTERSQSGVEQLLERQVKADSKVLAKYSQKFKSSRRISSHWLIFLLIVAGHDSMFLEAFQRRFDLQSVLVWLGCSSVSEIMTYFSSDLLSSSVLSCNTYIGV